jgi:diguanylate cyclase
VADANLPAAVHPFGPVAFLADRLHEMVVKGRSTEALLLAERHEWIARALRDDRTVTFISQARMYALLALGRLQEALAVGESLLRVHRATGSRTGEAKSLADVAEILVRLGRIEEGVHALARALAMVELVPRSSVRYCTVFCSLAEAARAAELYELADDCARIAGEPYPDGSDQRADAAMQRAEVMLEWALRLEQAGYAEEAQIRFRRVVAILRAGFGVTAEAGPGWTEVPLAAALVALGLVKSGETDQGARLAVALLAPMRSAGQFHEARLAHLAYGTALLAAGDLASARRELTAAEEFAGHSGQTIQRLVFRHELAVLAAHEFPGTAARDILAALRAQAAHLWRLRLERKSLLHQARRRVQLEAEHDTANRAATQDALTGLGNRRSFDRQVAALDGRSRRGSTAEPETLLLIDLDHFKLINDCHSHSVGDQVLREIGTILRTHCRADDIPVRFGGDEFAVLLRADLATAAEVAERIRQVVDCRDWSDLASGLQVTLSMGVAALAEGMSGQDLFDAADRQLYVAKQQGRNQLAALSH